MVPGKDRTLQCYTGSTAQAVVWRKGGQMVQEKGEQAENENAAKEVVAVGQEQDAPEVPV